MTKNQKNAVASASIAASIVVIATTIMEARRLRKATGIIDQIIEEAKSE